MSKTTAIDRSAGLATILRSTSRPTAALDLLDFLAATHNIVFLVSARNIFTSTRKCAVASASGHGLRPNLPRALPSARTSDSA